VAYVVPCVRFNDVVRTLMAEICVPVSRLVEVAVVPSSTPRFSLSTVTSLTNISVLLHPCNTRYEWLVRPCSAETCTLQETPKLRLAHQRDCRKTPSSKNVQKKLPQQAKKQPKYCQNVVRNIKNQTLFSVSVPLFKNYF
jgi:hypothetical protein